MTKQELLTEKIIDNVLSGAVQRGRLIVNYPSGNRRTYGDKSKPVTLTIKSLPLSQLKNPPMFIGESYMNGNIKIKEDELDTFFSLMSQNQADPKGLKVLEKFQKRQAN